jgi:hypothetical protein
VLSHSSVMCIGGVDLGVVRHLQSDGTVTTFIRLTCALRLNGFLQIRTRNNCICKTVIKAAEFCDGNFRGIPAIRLLGTHKSRLHSLLGLANRWPSTEGNTRAAGL